MGGKSGGTILEEEEESTIIPCRIMLSCVGSSASCNEGVNSNAGDDNEDDVNTRSSHAAKNTTTMSAILGVAVLARHDRRIFFWESSILLVRFEWIREKW